MVMEKPLWPTGEAAALNHTVYDFVASVTGEAFKHSHEHALSAAVRLDQWRALEHHSQDSTYDDACGEGWQGRLFEDDQHNNDHRGQEQ